MENFDWTSFLFYSALGWIVAKIISTYLDAKNQEMASQISDLQQRIADRVITVKIEKHGEVFYFFDKTTDAFVAQGRTIDELKHHCDARFKNKVVIANDDELAQAGLK